MHKTKSHALAKVTSDMGVNINYLELPEFTDDNQWTFRWVASNGRRDQGTLIAIPRHRRSKGILRGLIKARLLSEGFDEETSEVLSRIVNHKPFDSNKLNMLKGLTGSRDAWDKIKDDFDKERPNVIKYTTFESLGIERPVDYNTYKKLIDEVSRFYKLKDLQFNV